MILRAAASTATVLLRGESGTGKEVAARALHGLGPRATGPFVRVHCAALPDSLLESELFGYEKGAFTGAVTRKPGRVEIAEGGTLFLDEIGDVTPAIQVKLLRLLQEREYERLGSVSTLRADVRFVAATHRDLEAMIGCGEFREDLYYRLSVLPIWLPPLREREDDVRALAQFFCEEQATACGRPDTRLDPKALDVLQSHSWPGNVRQLQNFIGRLVLLSDGPVLRDSDVLRELSRGAPISATRGAGGLPSRLQEQRREAERGALKAALHEAGGNRARAARLLGVSRRTLYNKLESLGVGER
jgi:two-component system response regulator AtoC